MKNRLIIGILSFFIGAGCYDYNQIIGSLFTITGLALLVVSAKKGGYWIE